MIGNSVHLTKPLAILLSDNWLLCESREVGALNKTFKNLTSFRVKNQGETYSPKKKKLK